MSFDLIIDGYNLIGQSPELRSYEREELDKGREMLIKKLLAYQRIKKHAITVVFDGWREGSFSEHRDIVRGIMIIFSRRGEKADEVIKRLASQGKERTVVVTSDRDLGYACALQGCKVITSQEFDGSLELAEYREGKGSTAEEEGDNFQWKGTKKKGPSRRLPKSQRQRQTILKKL